MRHVYYGMFPVLFPDGLVYDYDRSDSDHIIKLGRLIGRDVDTAVRSVVPVYITAELFAP